MLYWPPLTLMLAAPVKPLSVTPLELTNAPGVTPVCESKAIASGVGSAAIGTQKRRPYSPKGPHTS